jgi:hypothetical protein
MDYGDLKILEEFPCRTLRVQTRVSCYGEAVDLVNLKSSLMCQHGLMKINGLYLTSQGVRHTLMENRKFSDSRMVSTSSQSWQNNFSSL